MTTKHFSGRVITSDKLDLVWQSWIPEVPEGVMMVIHGLAEHGGRYRDTATFFVDHGWAVYTCDLRSHGLSPDMPGAGRVHVNRFSDFLLDVEALLGLAKSRHPDLPLYCLGHSMGGLITILYALQNPQSLQGAIISSPALGTHPEFKPPLYLKLMVSILSRVAPRMLVDSELDSQAISRDAAVVKAYADDPLVSQKVSTRWYSEIIRSMKKAHNEASALQIPMLVMQSGADRLVDPGAAARWVQLTPDGLVEYVLWEDLYHEMFNEPEKDQVRSKTLQWLATRLSQ
ncbi:MAG: lysophospholipase [Xanthomonadales bacterium]|nr:lysophospholipase [Xanthomonadales bacterium]MDH3939457.1 lysophospholipase [Xanthomonadales bacterium]MDH3999795.1 lysophospholipase [Xanthomonadales bacterium]